MTTPAPLSHPPNSAKSLAREFARRGVRVQAFVEVDPRKIGRQIHGAPVLGVEAVRGVAGAFHWGLSRVRRAGQRWGGVGVDRVAMA
ncbi:MAG: hypothetical protein OXI76_00335 [Gemmatimonadota bacterium]|nr:hypothetical protein [Gemmatimonadota bacterium]